MLNVHPQHARDRSESLPPARARSSALPLPVRSQTLHRSAPDPNEYGAFATVVADAVSLRIEGWLQQMEGHIQALAEQVPPPPRYEAGPHCKYMAPEGEDMQEHASRGELPDFDPHFQELRRFGAKLFQSYASSPGSANKPQQPSLEAGQPVATSLCEGCKPAEIFLDFEAPDSRAVSIGKGRAGVHQAAECKGDIAPGEGRLAADMASNTWRFLRFDSGSPFNGDEESGCMCAAPSRCSGKGEPPRTGCLADFVQGDWFERASLVVIFLNAIFSIYITNYAAQLVTDSLPAWMDVLEGAFMFWYVFEVLLKLLVHRTFFFGNLDKAWNVFDFAVVMAALLAYLTEATLSFNPALMRLSRLLRFSKVFHIFKVLPSLPELRVVLDCMLGSALPLFSACALMALVLLIFALILVQSMTAFQINNRDQLDEQLGWQIRDSYGSVQLAMVALFQSSTGGRDWGDLYDLVLHTGTMNGVVFVLYVITFTFAVSNIVTGVFVEKALRAVRPDIDSLALERRRQEQEIVRDLYELVKAFDKDGTGKISRETFHALALDRKVGRQLQMRGLSIKDVSMLFEALLGTTDASSLDIATLVAGCAKIKGAASSLDVEVLNVRMQGLMQEIRQLRRHLIRRHLEADVGRGW